MVAAYEAYVVYAEENNITPLSYEEWIVTIKGEKGETGEQGSKGDKGDQGEKGETGEQGPKGEKGDTGAQGPKGDQGEKGDTGAQGPKGDQGEKGETGAQGPKGDQGEKGETGAQGPKGDQGEKGETGAQGPKGDQGEKGDTGAQGPKGDQGEKGETGAQGHKGDKGEQGEKGETGEQGKSAYEIFKEYYPEYTGTEKEWITAVATGNVCALFGHEYDDGVITTPATKAEDGVKTFTCKVCKATYTVIIPKIEVAEVEIYEVDGVKYVNYGSYPQSHVGNAATIAELNKLTTTNDRGYYEYKGNEYAKITAQPNQTGTYKNKYDNTLYYIYDDGSRVRSNATEWFKVEPIKWRVLAQNDGTVKVVSTLIIDASCYYINTYYRKDDDGNDIAPNNYKYSTIREFLNNAFFKAAFTQAQQKAIVTSEVDNSASSTGYSSNPYACENTLDKVFLLSYAEAFSGTYFFNDAQRQLKVTDYAKGKGAYWKTETIVGYWWMRSPDYDNVDYTGQVGYSGGYYYCGVKFGNIGVVPALLISLA